MPKNRIFNDNYLCPPRGGTRLDDIFSQEVSNLLVYKGLIIKRLDLVAIGLQLGKEVCKEGWFTK